MPKKRSHTARYCFKAGKKILVDWVQAELTLEAIQLRSRREIHGETRTYKCKFGDHYHLTSEEQRTEVQGIRYSA